MITLSNPVKKLLSILLTISLLIFAYVYITNIVKQVNFSEISVDTPILIVSILLFSLSYICFSANWFFAARVFNKNASIDQGFVFIASQPYKYLPTSLFVFSSRAMYARKLGLTLKQGSVAQVVENMSIFASNFALFAIFFVAQHSKILAFSMCVVGVVLMFFVSRQKNIKISIKGKNLNIEGVEIVKMLVATILAWLLNGVSFVLLNIALHIDFNVFSILAANTIAFSMGILAFFAPGGVGVREVIYKLFSVTNVAIIYGRILIFFIDIVLGSIAIIMINRKTKRSQL